MRINQKFLESGKVAGLEGPLSSDRLFLCIDKNHPSHGFCESTVVGVGEGTTYGAHTAVTTWGKVQGSADIEKGRKAEPAH